MSWSRPNTADCLGGPDDGAQLLGGAYMLIAALASVRESRALSITIEGALQETKAQYEGLTSLAADGIAVYPIQNKTEFGTF